MYKINLTNIYNINKTRFQIKVITKRTAITHLSTKVVYLTDLNNQESLTTVKAVCADNNIIPLIFILKSDVLLKRYFENNIKTILFLR
jgi:hypothetical protein